MIKKTETVDGRIWDVISGETFYGRIEVENARIKKIERLTREEVADVDILPGFVDAHQHQESVAATAGAVAQLALPHGTIAIVSDPHEIANVCGKAGVEWMLEAAAKVPLKFHFGAPSCVPATNFETAGAKLDAGTVRELLERDDIYYLSEYMNYPGAVAGTDEALRMFAAAKELGKPIDGHAPGLSGEALSTYISRGISTEHECSTFAEAEEKLQKGMKILIREGSAAKNFNVLHPLIGSNPDRVMFCTDDLHPNEFKKGHILQLAQRAVKLGYEPMDVLRIASRNPVQHYKLRMGLVQQGDPADFVIMDDFVSGKVLKTVVDGELVAENGRALFPCPSVPAINHFKRNEIRPEDLKVKAEGTTSIRVIGVVPNEIVTTEEHHQAKIEGEEIVADQARDILKLVVLNRYEADAPPSIAFVKHFGLARGALASSVAHDSHNIIAVGIHDEDITKAINEVIRHQGALAATDGQSVDVLPLPLAGLMSPLDGAGLADAFEKLHQAVTKLGSPLKDPFMTLSFLALPVIPELKATDKGLFQATIFNHVPLRLT